MYTLGFHQKREEKHESQEIMFHNSTPLCSNCTLESQFFWQKMHWRDLCDFFCCVCIGLGTCTLPNFLKVWKTLKQPFILLDVQANLQCKLSREASRAWRVLQWHLTRVATQLSVQSTLLWAPRACRAMKWPLACVDAHVIFQCGLAQEAPDTKGTETGSHISGCAGEPLVQTSVRSIKGMQVT